MFSRVCPRLSNAPPAMHAPGRRSASFQLAMPASMPACPQEPGASSAMHAPGRRSASFQLAMPASMPAYPQEPDASPAMHAPGRRSASFQLAMPASVPAYPQEPGASSAMHAPGRRSASFQLAMPASVPAYPQEPDASPAMHAPGRRSASFQLAMPASVPAYPQEPGALPTMHLTRSRAKRRDDAETFPSSAPPRCMQMPRYASRSCRIACTNPPIVNSRAWTVTGMPSRRAVALVMGPMEATFTPSSAAAPATATKFCTVEELVKVIQSGLAREGCADAFRGALGHHGAVGFHHVHRGAAARQFRRHQVARHGRARQQHALAGEIVRGEGLQQAFRHIFLAHQVDLQVQRLDGRARGRADGADARAQIARRSRRGAVQALDEEAHAVGAGEDQPVVAVQFRDGAVERPVIGGRGEFRWWAAR